MMVIIISKLNWMMMTMVVVMVVVTVALFLLTLAAFSLLMHSLTNF